MIVYFFAQSAKIGENVSVHHCVTIGRTFNRKKAGVPIISKDSNKCFNKDWGKVFAHSYYE